MVNTNLMDRIGVALTYGMLCHFWVKLLSAEELQKPMVAEG